MCLLQFESRWRWARVRIGAVLSPSTTLGGDREIEIAF